MHVTILNLGKDIPIEVIGKASIAAFAVCSKIRPFTLGVSYVSQFPAGNDGVPIIAEVEDDPGSRLQKFHAALKESFDAAGVPYSKKFPVFKPHVTLAYSDPSTKMPKHYMGPLSWTVSEAVLFGGDDGLDRRIITHFPFEIGPGRDLTARVASRLGGVNATAVRVAARYQVACEGGVCTCGGTCTCGKGEPKVAARWENSMNGTHFSLHWNKTKWNLTEMEDGSEVPSMSSFGEGSKGMVSWEMPQVEGLLKKYDTTMSIPPDMIRREAHIKDDTGSSVREKLTEASMALLRRVEEEMDKDDSRLDQVRRIIREIAPKLVWKKVRA